MKRTFRLEIILKGAETVLNHGVIDQPGGIAQMDVTIDDANLTDWEVTQMLREYRTRFVAQEIQVDVRELK